MIFHTLKNYTMVPFRNLCVILCDVYRCCRIGH